jgi:hypothetical protein
MNILEKLKGLFTREEIPEEARSAFSSAQSTGDLKAGIDAVVTRNEMESNKLKKEIDRVLAVLNEEEGKIRGGSLEGRQKKYTLQYIKRLRSHLDNLDRRMDIYDKNINLCIQLIGKVQDMEAMAMRGVDEQTIDRIVMEWDDQQEKFMDVVHAGEVGMEGSTLATSRDKELERLEKEILTGEAPAEEPEEKEAPTPAAAAPAAPAGKKDEDEEGEEEGGEKEKMLE